MPMPNDANGPVMPMPNDPNMTHPELFPSHDSYLCVSRPPAVSASLCLEQYHLPSLNRPNPNTHCETISPEHETLKPQAHPNVSTSLWPNPPRVTDNSRPRTCILDKAGLYPSVFTNIVHIS